MPEALTLFLEDYRITEGLEWIWERIGEANKYIDTEKPWTLAPDEEQFQRVMLKLLSDIALIGFVLTSFLPETAEKIKGALQTGKTEPLFQRL
ncbi:MAG: hypothetical protein WDN67_03450 [Candidatus Moraniibacteriota bacterium]